MIFFPPTFSLCYNVCYLEFVMNARGVQFFQAFFHFTRIWISAAWNNYSTRFTFLYFCATDFATDRIMRLYSYMSTYACIYVHISICNIICTLTALIVTTDFFNINIVSCGYYERGNVKCENYHKLKKLILLKKRGLFCFVNVP